MVYLNKIEFVQPHVQEKINYFCDAVELLTESIGFPLCPVNTNTHLLVSGLRKLAEANIDRSKQKNYLIHYFQSHRVLMKPSVITEKYRAMLVNLLAAFDKFKDNKTESIDDTRKALILLDEELERTFFEHTISELSKAIMCQESLSKHGHKKIIEEAAHIYVTEFLFLGKTPVEVRKIFNQAIEEYRTKLNDFGQQYVYDIPVPDVLYELRHKYTYTKYKNAVKKYLTIWGLNKQFQNLFLIWKRAKKKRTFIFRVGNYHFDKDYSVSYENCFFSNIVTGRHNRYFNREGTRFLKEGPDYVFCEVTIDSGNESTALQRAIADAKAGLNYLNYHMRDDVVIKPQLQLKQYMVMREYLTSTTEHFKVRIGEFDMPYFKDLEELNKLVSHKAVAAYLNLDRIFLEAYGADTTNTANSNFWRYCESLFEGEKEAEEVRKKLVHYYSRKSLHHLLIGVAQMVRYFFSDIHNQRRTEELGYTAYQFTEMLKDTFTDIHSHLKTLVPIAKHPIITELYTKAQKHTPEQILQLNINNYHEIVKGTYIHRNLFQHSNISIPELQNIWFERLRHFVESLRLHIIKDLEAKPQVVKIEDLFVPSRE